MKTPPVNTLETEEYLICEALVREIGRAERWQSISAAWTALLHVRHMAKQMRNEANGGPAETGATFFSDDSQPAHGHTDIQPPNKTADED